MHLRHFPRPRRLLTTVAAFMIGFFILVNMMLRNEDSNGLALKFSSSNEKLSASLQREANDQYNDYVVQNQRKPKAANDKGYNDEIDHDDDDDDFEAETENDKSEKTQLTNEELDNFGDDDNYDDNYSEDIEKVLIEDNDDNGDDDYEEDYDNNSQMKQNEEIEPGSFLHSGNFNEENSKDETNFQMKIENLAMAEMNNLSQNSKVFSLNAHSIEKTKIANLVKQGIYWSKDVEKLVPKGFTIDEQIEWTHRIRRQKVQRLQHPEWQKCGRPKNAFIVTEDGSWLCGRYRDPQNKLVLGEVLSFYLSQLLGVNNVPAVVLSEVNDTLHQWHGIDFHNFTWKSGKIVAMIQWIDQLDLKLSHVKIPPLILKAYGTKEPVTVQSLLNSSLTISELSQLVQWGNLFVFDYITGNYDRVASMQDAAMQEKRPSAIKENIRNLRQSASTKKLWLIDNESGLLDSYELMYSTFGNGKNFIKFHQDMLRTMCIFDKNIAINVKKLANDASSFHTLVNYALKKEPVIQKIEKDKSFTIFTKRFPERLNEVKKWINHCMKTDAQLR